MICVCVSECVHGLRLQDDYIYIWCMVYDACVCVISDCRKRFRWSVPYLVFFNLVCLRVPDFLGHLTLYLLSLLYVQLSAGVASALVSCAYIIAMQSYMRMVIRVAAMMSAPEVCVCVCVCFDVSMCV